MNLLFTGKGSSGSWKVRGEQLGGACGAVVKPLASMGDCQQADAVVAVKRVGGDLLNNLRGSGRPWVWDVLDAYPQPVCTGWSRREAVNWVQGQIRRLQPSAIIWPNQRMRDDCDTGLPGLVLYHHYWPFSALNTIRTSVTTVGYEGAAYLGRWRPVIEEQCRRRGWQFRVNPGRLADLDIVLALRDPDFSGYAQRHWKSNVKLANAHGSGTPFVGQQECGYTETASGAEYWAETPEQLGTCFDWLTSLDTREQVHDRFLQRAYPVDRAARDVTKFLEGLK